MIDKHDISLKFRICQTKDEPAMHTASGCEGLEKQQYNIRHDAVRRKVPLELCRKYGVESNKKWYWHMSEKGSKSANSNVEVWKLVERSDITDRM